MSFLSDYRDFCSGLEVPPSYNLFCSLSALSSMLGGRVWTFKGDYIKIYPNLYIVLVGGPGLGKTTAMELSEKLLRHFKIPTSAESVTREKLIMDIDANKTILDFLPADARDREVSPYTVFASELSEFLGAGGVGMISFLTTIFSRDVFEVRTKNKGSTFIKRPYLNLIAGTTPDWITTYLKDDIISGGFSRRCLFILETARFGSNPLPKITPAMQAAWERCVARGDSIRKLSGEFKMSPEAEAFWITWYPTRFAKPDPNLVGYYETKDIQLLKVAMLLAVSEADTLILERRHLISGLELLSLVELNLSRVFQGIGRNELNAATSKVVDQLINAPLIDMVQLDGSTTKVHAVPEKRLRAYLWKEVNGEEMDKVLEHLINADKIGRAPYGDRVFVYLKQTQI